MQCQSCGTQYPDNFRTCPNCGAPAPMPNQRPYNGQPNPYNGQPQFNNAQQNPYNGQPQFNNAQQYPYNGQPQPNNGQQYPYGNPYAAPNQVPQGMSKHDFYHSPICKKYRGNIIASSVLIYVCVGINLLLIALLQNYTSLIDAAIMLGLGLAIHLAQSRVCSILLCVYGVINTIIVFLSSGEFGGWLILVAAIYAIVATFQYQSAWNKYSKSGQIPY